MRTVAMLAVMLLAPPTDALTQAVVRDSAGIVIVENDAPLWVPERAWRLSEEPVVSIGVVEGPEEYQLFRTIFGAWLDNGEVVVANAGTHEFRFYDSRGRFLRSAGGQGGGPGEFRELSRFWRHGLDSLVAFDRRQDRFSVWGIEGEVSRTFRLEEVPIGRRPAGVGTLGDGSLLVRASLPRRVGHGLSRDSAMYFRFSAEGLLLDTIVRRVDDDRYAGLVGEQPMLAAPPPLGRVASEAVASDGWYYGGGDRYSIEHYSLEGKLDRIIRRSGARRRVTAEMAAMIQAQVLETPDRFSGVLSRWRATIPLPDTMPAHGEIMMSDDGYLWVAEYRLFYEPPRWNVFDGDGRFLGTVETPKSGHIWQIGTDFVLGVWTDELDVEQVRSYRLTKP